MKNSRFNAEVFYKTACFFEAALIVLAMVLGWLSNINPFNNLSFSEIGLMNGVFATIPLLIIFFTLQQLPYQAMQNIKSLLEKTLGPPLVNRAWADIFVLACIAGFSEELLFRGFLQPWLESFWSVTTSLIVSNLLFAIVHAVTPLYLLLALLTGMYLGFFLDFTEPRNLLTPIVIHSLYDFVAFMVILNNYRKHI